MERLFNLPFDRWHIILAIVCLIAVPASVFSSSGWLVAHRDYVRAEQGRNNLFEQLHNPQTGYVVRLASCDRERNNANTMIRDQSARISEWAAAAEAAKAQAQASADRAQERVRAAERRVHDLLSQQPRDNEGRCEAAFRLIQEQVE